MQKLLGRPRATVEVTPAASAGRIEIDNVRSSGGSAGSRPISIAFCSESCGSSPRARSHEAQSL
ncbi:hypothetical protein WME90_47585 [Sorangium sp. So ce375]|uniref:hypothetical protein n=1 Tax=Sorangium sp. So ce375 TaxID=3133306 RepID=UPI003F5C4D3A